MSKISVKTTFEASRAIRPIFTGGSLSLDESGRLLASCVGEDVLITDLETGEQLASIEGDGEPITSISITPSASHLAICSRSLAMRIFSLPRSQDSTFIQPELLRSLKPHTSPVVTTAIDSTGSLLATGSADGSIKVWDIKRGYATHTFHGHGGVVSALCFFESSAINGDNRKDGKKRKNKQKNSNPEFIPLEESTEQSEVTARFRLASGSEDGKDSGMGPLQEKRHRFAGVPCFRYYYNVDASTWEVKRIIPVLESVEAAGFLHEGFLIEVTHDQEAASEQEGIVAVEYYPALPSILTVHVDQTLKFHSLAALSAFTLGTKTDALPVTRTIAGNDDEVIDLACVGPERSLLAMATNSEYIRIVSTKPTEATKEQNYFGADVARLEGHDDIIICIDVDWSGHWLVTGAKDNSAKLWRIDPASHSYTCFATFTGHAESLGAIALSRSPPPEDSAAFRDPLNHPPAFLVTGSQDRTIKRWDTGKLNAESSRPKAVYTRKAHDKDINALDVNHNATLFASASQDRTAKIWSLEDGSVLGILRGHKRGVWSIRFAPKDTPLINTKSAASTSRGLVATGSGDKTIKLWNLSDYSCLLTFEGHSNSVLKVLWLSPPRISSVDEDISSRGAAQVHPLVASAAGDGLVKIWSPYSGEVETTLDNHTDRVWALATPFPPSASPNSPSSNKLEPDFSLISGAADSTVTFWKDTTSTTLSAAVSANSARIEQDQQLQNYIHAGAYREAITLALQLNHPARLLSLFTTAMDTEPTSSQTLTGNPDIDTVIQSLSLDHLYLLLLRIRDWNTNARTSRVSQRLLFALFKSYPPSTFVELASRPNPMPARGKGAKEAELKDILHALSAYTERHYKRVEELVDESYLVEWVLGEMEGMEIDVDIADGDQNGDAFAGGKDVIMVGS
ncbi:F-box/WD repeat-containing protein 7 [Coccidioides immitis RMSCC 3703]|uniref:F-box/WD repeat-containing protein 7 n=1 Tax=Coccidioides immitis RMSCC 3703 TaxID=454286 RepID=A0A0J8QSE9_COCIT|nr:F-box/WD repeat-containing protein 7 [Coccidioides immitis RMSCC 3703]